MNQDSKTNYSLNEMLDTAKRLRSPGVSPRSGRKRRRRSEQPDREMSEGKKALVAVGIVLMVAVMIGVAWWLISKQGPSEDMKLPNFSQPAR